jgi:hypothetical protein
MMGALLSFSSDSWLWHFVSLSGKSEPGKQKKEYEKVRKEGKKEGME